MKILIADDHSLLREGIKGIVSEIPSVEGVDEAVDGREALSKIRENEYDLLILDITMPRLSGFEVLQSMRDLGIECRSMILSMHPDDVYATRAFNLGSVGYISKSASFDEIRSAIRKVALGGRYVSAKLGEQLAFNETEKKLLHETLSDREFQIMILLAKGKGLSEIASRICISDKTVSTYRSRIMKKMGMQSNAELTIYAVTNNLLVR